LGSARFDLQLGSSPYRSSNYVRSHQSDGYTVDIVAAKEDEINMLGIDMLRCA
jgi:hypothetical protein